MSNSAVPRLSHCPSACKPQGQNAMREKKTSFETVPKTNGQLPNFSPPRASGKASASFVLQAAACSFHLCLHFSLSCEIKRLLNLLGLKSHSNGVSSICSQVIAPSYFFCSALTLDFESNSQQESALLGPWHWPPRSKIFCYRGTDKLDGDHYRAEGFSPSTLQGAPDSLGSLGGGGSGSWSPPGQPEDARSIDKGSMPPNTSSGSALGWTGEMPLGFLASQVRGT